MDPLPLNHPRGARSGEGDGPVAPDALSLTPSVPPDADLLATKTFVFPPEDETSGGASRTTQATVAVVPATIRQGELEEGDFLGDCRIVRLLGEGGMGEVYLAEDTRLERPVAVKLLKRFLSDREIQRRFRHERRVLAGLTHPGIAQLYGAASTPEGRSYFVMEYVEGEQLDHYCNRHALDVLARLALFRKVCAAVAYAHQHLVVHRDLKPPNIRVTADGEPKLLDFGIAKLLDGDTGASHAENTLTVAGSMTPAYASPEQVRGLGVTTATDVYSLGVILYELLTGERPYAIKRVVLEELAAAICEAPIRRPSTVVGTRITTAATAPTDFRGTAPDKLRRQLSGDLDNIVAMALRKEPERRYATVAQFSEDLRRHLDGLPVLARRDTLGYRAAKFFGRNKVGVVAVVLVLLALVGGLVTTAREARRANREAERANRRFEDVRRLAKSMIFEVEPAIESIPGATQARATLIRRAVDYLDGLSRETDADRSLRGELATAYEKVGDVQGNPVYSNLGDLKGALDSYRKAQVIREALVREMPSDKMARHELAKHYEQLGTLLSWSNQVDQAVDYYRQALALRRPLLAAGPKEFKFRFGYASLLMTSGELDNWNGQSTEALRKTREALPIFQALSAEDPANVELRLYVPRCYSHLGDVLRDKGDYTAAESAFAQAHEAVAAVLAENPGSLSARLVDWAVDSERCEAWKIAGDNDRAIAAAPAMVAKAQALLDKDPKNTAFMHNLANSLNTYGGALVQAQRWAEAIDPLRKAAALDRALTQISPENGEYPRSLGDCLWTISRAEFRLGRLDEAKADASEAMRLLRAAAAKDPANTVPARGLVKVYIALGEISGAQKNLPEARQWFDTGREQLEGLIARGVKNASDEEDRATLHRYLEMLPSARDTEKR